MSYYSPVKLSGIFKHTLSIQLADPHGLLIRKSQIRITFSKAPAFALAIDVKASDAFVVPTCRRHTYETFSSVRSTNEISNSNNSVKFVKYHAHKQIQVIDTPFPTINKNF